MKKSYLFITYKMSDGGAERVISHLIGELVKRGNKVAIFIYKRTDNEYKIHPEVSIFGMGDNYSENAGNKIRRTIQRIHCIRKTIREYRPNYIIPFLVGINCETFFASFNLNIPYIATIRNKPKNEVGIKRSLWNLTLKYSSAIWLQTDAQKEYLSEKNCKKAFVIPNPVNKDIIDKGKNHTYKKNVLNYVTMGRLEDQKNHEMLINAMIKAHKKIPKLILRIYGLGSNETKLKNLIYSNNAEGYIFLVGRTENVAEVLDNSDCFVLSSDYEGMPNALMEAMGIGLPCISTDCPTGPKELLEECGKLVPIGDIDAMCQAIVNMSENPLMAKECGKRAHQFIADFYNINIIADKLISECNKLD